MLVLVYGGKWKHGCRETLSNLAHAAAVGTSDPQKFIALAIDYRLDCIPAAQPPGAGNTDLCNWNYLSTDTTGNDGLNHGAAQHDVEDAMISARTQLQSNLPANYYTTMTPGPDAHAGIAPMGQSSRGHLSAMVGALEHVGSTGRPDVVVSISGPLKSVPQPTKAYPCNRDMSSASLCWNAHNQYLGCNDASGQGLTTGPVTACVPYYTEAFADASYRGGQTDPIVPIFFANGGGPLDATGAATNPELIPLSQANGFASDIQARGFISGYTYKFCIVDSNQHVDYLFVAPCETEPFPGLLSMEQCDRLHHSLDRILMTYVQAAGT